jgi:hypothetical protein
LGPIWHWSFYENDFCSDSFPLAWAFVVPQGKPQGLQSEAQGTHGYMKVLIFFWTLWNFAMYFAIFAVNVGGFFMQRKKFAFTLYSCEPL